MTSLSCDNLNLGQRIRREANYRGITQQDLAKLLGFTSSAISQKLSGRVAIKATELEAIADYLHVSTDLLLGREAVK